MNAYGPSALYLLIKILNYLFSALTAKEVKVIAVDGDEQIKTRKELLWNQLA